jgi:hypothetical protein
MITMTKSISAVEDQAGWWVMHFADGTMAGVPKSAGREPKKGEEIEIWCLAEGAPARAFAMDGEVIYDEYEDLGGQIAHYKHRAEEAEQELRRIHARYGPILAALDNTRGGFGRVRKLIDMVRRAVGKDPQPPTEAPRGPWQHTPQR